MGDSENSLPWRPESWPPAFSRQGEAMVRVWLFVHRFELERVMYSLYELRLLPRVRAAVHTHAISLSYTLENFKFNSYD